MTETLARINNALQGYYPPDEIHSLTRLVMAHVCGLKPYQLLMGKGTQLSDTEEKEINGIIERLKRFEPIQYILGETGFYGLTFTVNSSVLIPRPETEELVDRIIREHAGLQGRIIDIGTGSGCIAVALSKYLPQSEVVAVDISEEALATARENNRTNGTSVAFVRTDILSSGQAGKDIEGIFDVIVSNPPYVLETERECMEENVLKYEPGEALFVPDSDPLRFYRAIASFGRTKLNDGGRLYFEINARYGKDILELLQHEGYTDVELWKDLSGKDRMIKAIK